MHKSRLLLLPIAFICSTAARSQVIIGLLFGDDLNTPKLEFGLTAGLNYATMDETPDAHYRTGLYMGLYFNYTLGNERWVLHPEAIAKSGVGTKGLAPYAIGDPDLDTVLAGAKVQRDLNYLGLALLTRYRVWDKFYLEAGPQITMRSGGKDKFIAEDGDDELMYTHAIKDKVTLFDSGVTVGLAYKLRSGKSMAFDLRYYHGLVDVFSDASGKQTNSYFQALVSFPVGAGKAEAKRAAKEKAAQ